MSDSHINYFRYCTSSAVNGPGNRAVLWAQGCTFHCPGCFNSEGWDLNPNIVETVESLFTRIAGEPDIEGVTFSGGEPFLQAKSLGSLAAKLQNAGLSVVCYTGYTFEELMVRMDSETDLLLSKIDILIAGRYDASVPADKLWVGSGNQEVLFLSSRYGELRNRVHSGGREFEVQIGSQGEMTVTGFFRPGIEDELNGRIL